MSKTTSTTKPNKNGTNGTLDFSSTPADEAYTTHKSETAADKLLASIDEKQENESNVWYYVFYVFAVLCFVAGLVCAWSFISM